MKKGHRVEKSFNNTEGNRCVDIIVTHEGVFRFQEWRREPEDISGWFLMLDSAPTVYASEIEAIDAARQAVSWFNELR